MTPELIHSIIGDLIGLMLIGTLCYAIIFSIKKASED